MIEGIALGDPSVKDKRILKVNCIRKITFLPPTVDFGDRRGGNGLENDVDGMDGKNSNDFADLLATYLSVRIYSSFVFFYLLSVTDSVGNVGSIFNGGTNGLTRKHDIA